MQQSLLLQRRHSTRPRGALLLVNCVCVALVCHSQLCPAAATGLRSRASEGAHQATNPLVLLRNKAVQLQTQANVLSDIGSYDHAQAVLRHGDNILSDSPFNMALFCRSPERCASCCCFFFSFLLLLMLLLLVVVVVAYDDDVAVLMDGWTLLLSSAARVCSLSFPLPGAQLKRWVWGTGLEQVNLTLVQVFFKASVQAWISAFVGLRMTRNATSARVTLRHERADSFFQQLLSVGHANFTAALRILSMWTTVGALPPMYVVQLHRVCAVAAVCLTFIVGC